MSVNSEAEQPAGTQRRTELFAEIPLSTLGHFSLHHPAFHSMCLSRGARSFLGISYGFQNNRLLETRKYRGGYWKCLFTENQITHDKTCHHKGGW